jgi:hypothetical protein
LEAYFNIEKKRIKVDRKKALLATTTNEFDRRLLELEIVEAETQVNNINDNVQGAIRRVSGFMAQYQNILNKLGKDELTDEDFEADEERYHIMKAFEQGLCAARSHGGTIDEGNHIYFYQIGINGTAAQVEVSLYLADEGKRYSEGDLPPHDNTWQWLHRMADKYAGCAQRFVENKHMTLLSEGALHK